MTIEYQREALKFMVSHRDGKAFVGVIPSKVFDHVADQIVYELLEAYVKKYGTLPSELDMGQFKSVGAEQMELGPEVEKELDIALARIFRPMKSNSKQVQESLIKEAQSHMTRLMLKEYVPKIAKDTEEIKGFLQKMREVLDMEAKMIAADGNRGEFLISDWQGFEPTSSDTHYPTYLNGLNAFTAMGGFASPELIVFLAQPKSFKTGTLLNLAVEYARDGLDVYYADAENGNRKISRRARQVLVHGTPMEMYEGKHDKVMDQIVSKWHLGGDFRNDFYPAHTKSVEDVEAELDYLWENFKWKPQLICWDYFDLFEPIDKSIKDKRFKIQAVYFDVIRLNAKLGTFSMGLSQVNRNAVNKEVITIKDFGEDFGKAANCHAAFAICRTPEEMEQGYARIIPVAQRDGVPYRGDSTVCLVKIDEERMVVEELDMDEIVKTDLKDE